MPSAAEYCVPGVMLDYDSEGHVIGVEVLSVGLRVAGTYHHAATQRSAAE